MFYRDKMYFLKYFCTSWFYSYMRFNSTCALKTLKLCIIIILFVEYSTVPNEVPWHVCKQVSYLRKFTPSKMCNTALLWPVRTLSIVLTQSMTLAYTLHNNLVVVLQNYICYYVESSGPLLVVATMPHHPNKQLLLKIVDSLVDDSKPQKSYIVCFYSILFCIHFFIFHCIFILLCYFMHIWGLWVWNKWKYQKINKT